MIDTFYHGETGQRLSILDYDEGRTNVRYKAVINDAQLSVLHLQSVDTEDTQPDVSQLSLCPGVLETEVLQTVSSLQIGVKTLTTRVGGIIGVGKELLWILIFCFNTLFTFIITGYHVLRKLCK